MSELSQQFEAAFNKVNAKITARIGRDGMSPRQVLLKKVMSQFNEECEVLKKSFDKLYELLVDLRKCANNYDK